MTQSYDNKPSTLLTNEENEHLFRLLGNRCQTLSTTVAQLFCTQAPNHSQWIKKDIGILCFIKDNVRKSYFFRLFCLKRNGMIWEQEMYNSMEYIASCTFLHTFEGDEYMIAFNFANESEAKELKAAVETKLQVKKRRREVKRSSRNIPTTNFNHSQSPRMPSKDDFSVRRKPADLAAKQAKRKRNITKADIGAPSEFRHISHVGWDPDKGFDFNTEDPHLSAFFEKAGVSEKQLQDRETREFIYDFINKHGGREAVQEEINPTTKKLPPHPPSAGPPVPPRGSAPRPPHSRAAPPPPPSLTTRPAIVQKATTGTAGTPSPPRTLPEVFSPPPVSSGFTPPPPPPPPPPMEAPLPPPQENVPVIPDVRTALMESIRTGAALKPVEPERRVSEDSRGDLLSEIRKGFQLKPCNEREVKPISPGAEPSGNDLAGALAKALAERNKYIHSEDDSTSDTDSNEDEWDA